MEGLDLLEKNKNRILNLAIIVIAVFIAFKIFNSQNQQIGLLERERAQEVKKNKVLENIGRLETKVDSYKKVFSKKDLGSVMDSLGNIAKGEGVKIISIKPVEEQKFSDYVKSSFLLLIKVNNYHNLGEFISRVENYKDLYLVEEIGITAPVLNEASLGDFVGAEGGSSIEVNLKISTITYL